jgi:hypothetical protein
MFIKIAGLQFIINDTSNSENFYDSKQTHQEST